VTSFRYPLNLQLFAGEKTEPATYKKRQDARKKGQVAKSSEVPSAFLLLFCFLTFMMFGGFFKDHYMKLFISTFHDYMLTDVTVPNVTSLFGNLLQEALTLLSPIFIVTILIALITNYMQIGVLFTGDPLMMKLNKLNPIEGAKRIFGMRALVDFLKTMIKMIVIGLVVFTTLWGEKEKFIGLAHMPLQSVFSYVAGIVVGLGVKIGVIFIVLSLFDYLYQRHEYEKQLRMSKQDIKDEYKKSEGDPLIKGKIKERQRKMAMQRMMAEIPKADVIITNPTHYAIAIRYEAKEMEAPRVIAKGADFIALRIREIAKENGVALMENRPLARALFDQVEIGQTIPGDLFQAVAEVLAYVYKLKSKTN
jgi:flagellar biosynthetic protein FlhB